MNDYLQVSSLAVLVFDYLITFSDEVEFIWNGKMSTVKALFYITRYLPFFDGTFLLAQQFLPGPPQLMCKSMFHVQAWLYLFAFLVTNAILLLRTYAIWENNKNLALSLFALLIACITGAGYCVERFILSLTYGPSPSHYVFPGCFVVDGGRIVWVSITLLLLFHTVVLALTLLSAIRQGRLTKSSLLGIICRDGIIMYAYLFGIAVINIIFLTTVQTYLTFSLMSFHRILQAVLTERLVINIRKAVV